jgi:hypothetical protein
MAKVEALTGAAEVFGDEMFADYMGEKFSCREADAIARLLVVAGHDVAAQVFLLGHAQGDKPGDFHRDEDDERPMHETEIRDYVRALSE